MKIKPEWIDWAQKTADSLKDGSFFVFPSDGAIFRIDKTKKQITLICCRPEFRKSEVEVTNEQVFGEIGYSYLVSPDVSTSPKNFLREIYNNWKKYGPGFEKLAQSIADIFQISRNKVNDYIEEIGRHIPINPVTIYNPPKGNVTVSRLWVSTNKVSDAPHRFDPSQPSQQWDKPICILLWDQEGQLLMKDGLSVDEEDLIRAVKTLQSAPEQELRLWGRPQYSSEDSRCLFFSKLNDELSLAVFDQGCDLPNKRIVVKFAKFVEGMRHLFPGGEIV